MHDPESNRGQPMPPLKPFAPAITQRRYFPRIGEPCALTMEHDTESLGTDNLDRVVGRALQCIFKHNRQFESWLQQHPKPTPKLTRSETTFTRTASEVGAL